MDNGETLVEDHVESYALGLLALAVHSHFVAVIDHEGRQHGEMNQPFPAKHPVIAITAANADMTDIYAEDRGIRVPGFQFVARLDDASLIADACQP